MRCVATTIHMYIILIISRLLYCPQAGWTALHLAAQEGKVNVMRLLIEAEAQLDIETGVSCTCILYYRAQNFVVQSKLSISVAFSGFSLTVEPEPRLYELSIVC